MAVVTTYIIKKITPAGDVTYYGKNANGTVFYTADQLAAYAFTTNPAATAVSDSLEAGGGPAESDALSFTVVQVDTDTGITLTPGTADERTGARRSLADAALTHLRNVIGMVGDRAELTYIVSQNQGFGLDGTTLRQLCDDPLSAFRRIFRGSGNVSIATGVFSFVAPYQMLLTEVIPSVSVAPLTSPITLSIQNVTTAADLNDNTTPGTPIYKTITYPRDAIAGDVVTAVLNGTTYSQAFDTDSNTTFQKLADKLKTAVLLVNGVQIAGALPRVLHVMGSTNAALTLTSGSVTGATTDAATVATPACAEFGVLAGQTSGNAITFKAFKNHLIAKGATVRLDITGIGTGTVGSGLTVTFRGIKV